jgi:hypothetical protein
MMVTRNAASSQDDPPTPSTESSSTKQHLQEGKRDAAAGPAGPRVSPGIEGEVDIG